MISRVQRRTDFFANFSKRKVWPMNHPDDIGTILSLIFVGSTLRLLLLEP